MPQPKSTASPRCIAWPNGDTQWFDAVGELHNDSGPAIVYADGTKEWLRHGKHHREDGPAVEGADGTRGWFLNGLPHRLEGPAIELPDATRKWCVNGFLHRLDGPADEHPDGTKEWYREGVRHREDGPAVERADGTNEWWLNGQEFNGEEEHLKALQYLQEKERERKHKALHAEVDAICFQGTDTAVSCLKMPSVKRRGAGPV